MGTIPKYTCQGKCALTAKPDPETMAKLEIGFENLYNSASNSLLKKYLTRELFDKLKVKKTKMGSSLLDCIQSGLTHFDSGIGVYAPDPDAYTTYADLFGPIIEDYHYGFGPTDVHPPSDFGDLDSLVNVDPCKKYVVSIRVRCGRTVSGFPFNPCLTEQQYKDLEKKIAVSLAGLSGEHKGIYHPLVGMDPVVQTKLIDEHYLFKEGDRFLQAGNACRFWPIGRGIYYNEDKTFIVWVNEEDHMRIISMQQGGDLGACYRRMVTGVQQISKKIDFVRHDKYGFLTFCPTNLGTTIRASVHIKVPKLAKNKSKLDEVAAKYNLQVRGTTGEHTEAVGGIYDISNKQRLGLTEYQAVKTMQDGIIEIIKIEQSMQ